MSVGEMFATSEMSAITCCNCGIEFHVPSGWNDKRREDGEFFYCPNGHRQHYSESELRRKEREIARLKQRLDQKDALCRDYRNERDTANRRASAQKGIVTRIKNRISKGVCPCCNRHFEDLQRHIQTKHPDYVTSED